MPRTKEFEYWYGDVPSRDYWNWHLTRLFDLLLKKFRDGFKPAQGVWLCQDCLGQKFVFVLEDGTPPEWVGHHRGAHQVIQGEFTYGPVVDADEWNLKLSAFANLIWWRFLEGWRPEGRVWVVEDREWRKFRYSMWRRKHEEFVRSKEG